MIGACTSEAGTALTVYRRLRVWPKSKARIPMLKPAGLANTASVRHSRLPVVRDTAPWTSKMITPDEPSRPATDANEVVSHYCQNAEAAPTDPGLAEAPLGRAIPNLVLVTDQARTMVSVNAQLKLTSGYHRSEVIGNTAGIRLQQSAPASGVVDCRRCVDDPRVRRMAGKLKLPSLRMNTTKFAVPTMPGQVVIRVGGCAIAVIG
jgi:hypothetical protein